MSTPPLELPLLSQPVREPERDQRVPARRALGKLLAWLSLAWMTVEGTVGVIAGLIVGSIALAGFGLDNAIEGIASIIVV